MSKTKTKRKYIKKTKVKSKIKSKIKTKESIVHKSLFNIKPKLNNTLLPINDLDFPNKSYKFGDLSSTSLIIISTKEPSGNSGIEIFMFPLEI